MTQRKLRVPDFSAIYCQPQSAVPPRDPDGRTVLNKWTLESGADTDSGGTMPSLLDAQTGEYVVPIDGLYTIVVQLIRLHGGSAHSATALPLRLRRAAHYAVEIRQPAHHVTAHDAVASNIHDVGNRNFAQLVHLAADARVSCLRLHKPETAPSECVRLKIELVQRKRKRPEEDNLDVDDPRRERAPNGKRRRVAVEDPSSEDDDEDEDDEDDGDDGSDSVGES